MGESSVYKKFEDLLRDLKNTSRLSVTEETEEGEEVSEKYLIFNVGKESFALPVKQLKEVLPDKQIIPVPGAPPSVHGVINYNNHILPVTNVHHLLRIPYKGSNGSYLLVVKDDKFKTALLIDGVVDLVDVRQKDVKPKILRPVEYIDRMIAGEIYYKDKLATLFNLAGID